MFGSKGFIKDLDAMSKIDNKSEELACEMMYKAIERYCKKNFIAGVVTAMVGSTIAIVTNEYSKVHKKNKKIKELKDTDK